MIVVAELPITLIYLHNGFVPTESICTGWIVLNYSLFLVSIALMAWASVERYLFIYHEQIIVRHYVLLHYVRITTLWLYSSLFYMSTVVLYKCESIYDVHQYVYGGACYQRDLGLGLIDRLGNVLCAVFFTFIINLILIIRNVMQRHRMKRSIITARRSQQWVRTVISFFYIYIYVLAPLTEVEHATTFSLFCVHGWMDSILYDCTYSNICQ
jgi:hypothetical protein